MRRLFWPLIILVALAILFLILQNQKSKSIAPEKITNFLNLNLRDLDSLEIQKRGSTVRLRLHNGLWEVLIDSNYKPADTAAINMILAGVSAIEVGAVESENPARQMVYQVDTMLGTKLTFYGNARVLASLMVGKNAQSFGYSYIRKPDSDKVYSAAGIMGYMFNKPALGWRDKTILSLDTSKLISVDFAFPDQQFSLMRADSLWQMVGPAGPQTALRDSVELLKRTLADLKVDDFYQPMDSAVQKITMSTLVMTIKLSDQAFKLLFLGNSENGNRFYLRKEGADEIYVLYKAKYSRLYLHPENFVSAEKKS